MRSATAPWRSEDEDAMREGAELVELPHELCNVTMECSFVVPRTKALLSMRALAFPQDD